MQILAKAPKQIDLSNKTPDEIFIYLQAILDARYELSRKGFEVKINRKSKKLKNLHFNDSRNLTF